ncbi:MAG: V-type ATP synthase subunit F [Candidatus Hermodarchaeota archaeon]
MERSKVTAIADETTCSWLQLAGIGKVHPISDPKEAEPLLKNLLNDEEVALVLVSPEVARANTAMISAFLEKVYPIVVTLPLKKPELEDEEEDPLNRLVRLAVGVDVDL